MNPITEYALMDVQQENTYNQSYILEKSKDNKSVIRLAFNGKEVYIGSKYLVQRDIDLFMKQMEEYNINTIFIVFGIGTGEHIIELLNSIGKTNKVLIIEPDNNILTLIRTSENYKKIVEDNRVVITLCDETKLSLVLYSFIEEFNINNLKLMIYGNYDKIYKDKLLKSHKVIKNFIEANAININTALHFSQQYFKSFIKNIKYIIKSAFINDFRDTFKGTPAVIVSAGPSLDKNIAKLKSVQDKFLILSGGRTISSLGNVGIKPHMVAVVDSGESSYRVIKDSLDCKAPLAFCEVTNSEIVEQYSGDKVFFQEGFNLGEVTSELLGVKVDSLWQGGSVAHTCASLAKYLGCNPIIFIGQDFAYTNERLHANIASKETVQLDGDQIFVDDVYGNKVRTNSLLDSYRRLMEQFIDNSRDVTFINCTEGGANMKGTKVMDLEVAIREYGNIANIDEQKLKNVIMKNIIDEGYVKNSIEEVLHYMKEIKTDCINAIKYSDELMNYYLKDKIKDTSKQLNNISKINKKVQKLRFINNLLQPIIYSVLMNQEYIEKPNESLKEKGIRLAKQTKELYTGIVQSIEAAIPEIKQCLLEISDLE